MMSFPEPVIRVHPRAKRARIRVTAREGIVVTVPPRCSAEHVDAMLAQERPWLEGAWAKAEARRACAERLPESIDLPVAGISLDVAYDAADSDTVRVIDRGNRLVLVGRVSDAAACRGALRAWLLRGARRIILPRLEAIAQRAGLSHGRVTFRLQRSRWGSCGASGSLSLNAALLFLDPWLVDHVLAHELVHTRVFDHSALFWEELEAVSPGARAARRELRRAWELLPSFLDAL